VLAAFAASFGFAFSIFREVSPALMSARGLTAVAVFATLASGLGSALGIIREVPAATLAALAGNGSLLFFIHRREAAVRSLGLVSISHNKDLKTVECSSPI